VHQDHSVFAEGLALRKKLKLTFFSEKLSRNVLMVCAPLHYSEGKLPGDGLDSYYFWDYRASKTGKNVLALSPVEILHMKLTDEPYSIEEFTNSKDEPDSAKSIGIGRKGT